METLVNRLWMKLQRQLARRSIQKQHATVRETVNVKTARVIVVMGNPAHASRIQNVHVPTVLKESVLLIANASARMERVTWESAKRMVNALNNSCHY